MNKKEMADKIRDLKKLAMIRNDLVCQIGDIVDVHVRILEGNNERIQIFNGVVIGRSGSGTREMFVVRRIVQGEGVELKFPIHSPRIAKIVVKRSSSVRRAKLMHIRDLTGKVARLRERFISGKVKADLASTTVGIKAAKHANMFFKSDKTSVGSNDSSCLVQIFSIVQNYLSAQVGLKTFDDVTFRDAVWLSQFLSGEMESPITNTEEDDSPGVQEIPVSSSQSTSTPTPSTSRQYPLSQKSFESNGGVFSGANSQSRHLASDFRKELVRGSRKTVRLPSTYVPGRDEVRAFKALSKTADSKSRSMLDEIGTVEQWIENRIHYPGLELVIPKLKSIKEKRTAITLIFDSSLGMEVWEDITLAWKNAISSSGFFRSVRTYYLNCDFEKPILQTHGSGDRKRLNAIERTIQDPGFASEEVVLVITDVSSRAWQNSTAYAQLAKWSLTTKIGILCPLPEKLWKHSTLNDHGRTMLYRKVNEEVWRNGRDNSVSDSQIRLIPVSSLKNQVTLKGMTQLIGSTKYAVQSRGIRVFVPSGDLGADSKLSRPANCLVSVPSTDQIVTNFRRMASHAGVRLAWLFAHLSERTGSCNLRNLRALSEELRILHSEDSQLKFDRDNEAEVLLGGLLELHKDDDVLSFCFHQGVRERFLESSQLTIDGIDYEEILKKVQQRLRPHPDGEVFEPQRNGLSFGYVEINLSVKLECLTVDEIRLFLLNRYGHKAPFAADKDQLILHVLGWYDSDRGPGYDRFLHDLVVFSNNPQYRHRKLNNLPYPSFGKQFVGRESEIDQIRDIFADISRTGKFGSNWLVITGIAGSGKTQMAVEYAWKDVANYNAILFVRGDDISRITFDLATLAAPYLLDLKLDDSMLPGEKASLVMRHLTENPGWLLIIDKVDNAQAAAYVEKILPELRGGHVLITSRFRQWDETVINLYELDLLPIGPARDLILALTDAKRRKTADDFIEAERLARDLGRLSLALYQAAAYIKASLRLSIAEYRALWAEKASALAGFKQNYLYNTDEGKELLTILTTWQTTFDRLSNLARWWADHLAFLAPEPVPADLAEALQALEPGKNRPGWNGPHSAVAELHCYSLLDRSAASFPNAGQMHRLVQIAVREVMSEEHRSQTRAIVAQGLRQAFSGDAMEHTNWPRLEPLVPHVEVLLALTADDTTDPSGDLGFLGNQCGLMLATMARFAAAEPLYRRASAIYEQSFGPEHPNVARVLNNLAGLLYATNRLAEAEPLFRRALAIDEKSFGPEHPKVATGLNNLAGLLQATNRLAEAEPLYRRALAIYEKSFGPEHPSVARGLNNLAGLLQATNRMAEAEPLYRRALAIDEQSFGPEHPNVATSLNNLAGLFFSTNRLAEAEPLFYRALAIDEYSFGPEHPNVATDLNNLAMLLKFTNRLAEAEPMYRRALSIVENSLGQDHPDVAFRLNNLAGLLYSTGRLAEAEPLYRRALAIDEKSFGPDHPSVATGLNNLAALLQSTNRLSEAEPLYRRALAIDEKSFGPQHPRVSTDLKNLAELLIQTNRRAEAQQLSRRALKIDRESDYSSSDLISVRTQNDLTNSRSTLVDELKTTGTNYPDSITSSFDEIIGLIKRRRFLEAVQALREVSKRIDDRHLANKLLSTLTTIEPNINQLIDSEIMGLVSLEYHASHESRISRQLLRILQDLHHNLMSRIYQAEPDLTSSVLVLSTPPINVRKENENSILCLGFLPDGRLVTGNWDNTARVWDLARPDALPVLLSGHDDIVNELGYAPDGRLVTVSGTTARIWDMANPSKEPIVLKGHKSEIRCLGFAPDGRLVTGSSDATARIWGMDDPSRPPLVLKGIKRSVVCLGFAPDGRLVTGSGFAKVLIWDLVDPTSPPIVLIGHEKSINCLEFAPDGRLVTGSEDKTVRVWNLARPYAPPLVLRGHEGGIYRLGFAPDGRLVTGSGDNTARVWDLARPSAPPVVLKGHEDSISGLGFTPDGRLVTVSWDGTIRLWRLPKPGQGAPAKAE